jgi:dTDP-4-dehydrorhamnose reductase
MVRVLVVGGTGLLGQYACAEARARGHEVLATYRRERAPDDVRFAWYPVDIKDSEAVTALVHETSPSLVVNAAAMTDVDGCERDPDEAKHVNTAAAGHLAWAAKTVGAGLVHPSTDYVFDGRGSATEETPPRPINVYGHTKLIGERLVLQAHPAAVVLRLSAVFGWNRLSRKTNSVTWILEKLEAGKEVPLFADQKITPTYAKTAAAAAFDLWTERSSGIFHVASRECVSRVEIGRAIADVFRIPNPNIEPIPLASVRLAAKRPLAPCLVVAKVEQTLKRDMPTLRDCLENMKATR